MKEAKTIGGTAFVGKVNFTLLLSFIPILIGATCLINWQFDFPQLRSVMPSSAQMKVNTAIGLTLSGLALLIFNYPLLRRFKSVGTTLAVIVTLLGLATLLEYTLDWNLGIDELLFLDQDSAYNRFPGRMSVNTAISFVLLGFCLVLIPWRPEHRLITILALIVTILGTISFAGYFWNVTEFKTDESVPRVAIHRAVAQMLLGFGILRINLKGIFDIPAIKDSMQRVERKVLAGFVFAIFLLVIFGGYTYRSSVGYSKSSQWVDHTQQVRIAINRLYSTMSNIETTQRNYILSGKDDQLDYYGALLVNLKEQQKKLIELVVDNPEQTNNSRQLEHLMGEKLEKIATGIQLYQEQGLAATIQYVKSARGIETTIAIRNLVNNIGSIEEKLLLERQAIQAKQGAITLASLLMTLTIATIILLYLYGSIKREMKARAIAESSLVTANRFLDSIFENIPNMVFIKEAREFRYVRLNRTGETLLSTSRKDLIGKNYYDFYRKEKADQFTARDREIMKRDNVIDVQEESVYVPAKGKRIFHTIRIPLHDEEGKATFLLGVTEDITERREAENQIRALNTKLIERAAEVEASNKELEAFSYSISHDLRAPLRHVQGYVQMLLEDCGKTLAEEPKRYLDVIAKSSEKMGNLIDDLLTFSRMGRTAIQHEKVKLDALVQEAVAGLEMQTRDRNIEWNIGYLPDVTGDQAMLKQVLVNLVSNAIKYSAPRDPAQIEIGYKEQDGPWAVFYVKDNGVGFEMQYASKLFGVFQRLHRADEFEGTGIGLANVQRIITRHGGRIWVEAELNKGACFYFTLKSA